MLFLFSYIYATNANMDYVQRFMASHGNLRLAPNSTQERLAACLRFLPLLVFDALAMCWYRVRWYRVHDPALVGKDGGAARLIRAWALPLAIASGILYALSSPSFLRTEGIPVLGWVCLVPVLLVLENVPLGQGILYGTLMGVIQTMISSFWLGTFNLLTLQFVTVVTFVQYVLFMAAALFIQRRSRGLGFLVLPAAWPLFDWLRSLGFLGYPWGMLGTSQYPVIPLIQTASVTGVWGVTLVVTLVNSVAARYVLARLTRKRAGRLPAIVLGSVLAASLGWGALTMGRDAAGSSVRSPGKTVRLALVQQDADPRKDDYRAVFETLKRLTNAALAESS